MHPKVSVVIPTYNRRMYVQKALDSVLSQTFNEFETIVVDDGSTDGTGDALRARYGDRIQYIWQENQGASVARNCGIDISKGIYIALLDSDDLWLPNKLATQVPILDANQHAVLVFSPAWSIGSNGQHLPNSKVGAITHEDDLTLESLCLTNRMGGAPSTALIRRSALERVDGFDPTLQFSEDWDLWIRLRQLGSFIAIDEPLAVSRRNPTSKWHSINSEVEDSRLASHLRILAKAFGNWPGTVPVRLRTRAMARQYGLMAFRDYFGGRPRSGQWKYDRAARLDSQHWIDDIDFPEKLISEFITPNYISERSTCEALSAAADAFIYPPSCLALSKMQTNSALSQLYRHFLFESFDNSDLAGARYCWRHAVWHDPGLLLNLGVWSIAIEAYLGRRSAEWLREARHQAQALLIQVRGVGHPLRAEALDRASTVHTESKPND